MCKTRDKVVAGTGQGRVMLIGSHPKYDDDLMGEPFQDRAGVYLKSVLNKVGLQAYLTLAVKCFPGKSKVEPGHIAACKRWLWEEIQLIQPRVIVTLGKLPTQLLLKLKKCTLKHYIDKFIPVSFCGFVAPYYDPLYLLERSSFDEKTRSFLTKVKSVAEGSIPT